MFEEKGAKVEIFCSYSHKDDELRQQFDSHVALLRRQKLVETWSDHRILAGNDWAGDIGEHLNSADIIALFVSSDFLASDYCYEKEMERAMEREKKKEAVVVPIVVRPCDWRDAPFAHLQATPPDAKPVTLWENRDAAWTAVAKSLKLKVKEVLMLRLQAGVPEVKFPITPIPSHENKCLPGMLQPITTDYKQAMSIYRQIAEDAEKMKKEGRRIAADIQTKVFQIEIDIPVNKAKTQHFDAMEGYVRE